MKVFVYGTLRAGQPNHHILGGARALGRATTPAAFRFHSLGPFPGMVRGGTQAVVGEVYEVDHETLANLDRLESHPRFYRRERIRLADGQAVEVYLLPERTVAGRPVIASGDWLAREGASPNARANEG